MATLNPIWPPKMDAIKNIKNDTPPITTENPFKKMFFAIFFFFF